MPRKVCVCMCVCMQIFAHDLRCFCCYYYYYYRRGYYAILCTVHTMDAHLYVHYYFILLFCRRTIFIMIIVIIMNKVRFFEGRVVNIVHRTPLDVGRGSGRERNIVLNYLLYRIISTVLRNVILQKIVLLLFLLF